MQAALFPKGEDETTNQPAPPAEPQKPGVVATVTLPDGTIEEVLAGYDSQARAYVIEDYPYGRKLRCEKRTWLEFRKGYGYRDGYYTIDPRNGRANAPHYSTYDQVAVMVRIKGGDEDGYIKFRSLHHMGWHEAEELETWLTNYGPALSAAERALLEKAIARKRAAPQQ